MVLRERTIKPGKYALIRSGFYGGSEYRGFRSKPDGFVTIEKEIVIKEDADYRSCPLVDDVPGLKSEIISEFNAKLDSGKIAKSSCLHLDLAWVRNLDVEIQRQRIYESQAKRRIEELEKIKANL